MPNWTCTSVKSTAQDPSQSLTVMLLLSGAVQSSGSLSESITVLTFQFRAACLPALAYRAVPVTSWPSSSTIMAILRGLPNVRINSSSGNSSVPRTMPHRMGTSSPTTWSPI